VLEEGGGRGEPGKWKGSKFQVVAEYLTAVIPLSKLLTSLFFPYLFSAVQNNNNQTLDKTQEEQKKIIIDIYRNKNQNHEMGSILPRP